MKRIPREADIIQIRRPIGLESNRLVKGSPEYTCILVIPSKTDSDVYGFIYTYASTKTYKSGGKLPFPAAGHSVKTMSEFRFDDHTAFATNYTKPGYPKERNPYYFNRMRIMWDKFPELLPFVFEAFPYAPEAKVNLPHEKIKELLRIQWEYYLDIRNGNMPVANSEVITKEIY